MAKKVKALIKLQIEGGKATPAPPVGPALGQHGVNIMGFCKEYNERTKVRRAKGPCGHHRFMMTALYLRYEDPPTTDLIKKLGSG